MSFSVTNPVWKLSAAIALAMAVGCSTPSPRSQGQAATLSPAPQAPVAPQPEPQAAPVATPFDQAVEQAASALFASVAADKTKGGRIVVIDPLIDGVTGEQTQATRQMQAKLTQIARERFPEFDVQAFSVENLRRKPLVLVGTFTGIDGKGATKGAREAYRICLALADLDSRQLVGKGTARSKMEGVDATPLAYFRDSPAWALDGVTEGYIKTCQGSRIGDPMDPFYVARIVSAASVQRAIDSYNAGRYREALDHYSVAMQAAAGDELRILNGVFLTNMRLGRKDASELVFKRIVDFGLERKRMAVRFLFKPGSTAFANDPLFGKSYPAWLNEVASQTAKRNACLEIVGHTSRSGPEAINERISVLRAESIKQKLEGSQPSLRTRTIANGVGSRENLVGTGRDDASDALDRRVVFKVIDCTAAA
ncbi:OmpA family protein [Niveibacterium sp. 24ML]|uniref:OmpA family protein n=1 Tax=Niveibacterium sp. 24ML TaxID=2985512 RepID=UPI00226D6FE0|nr:OmpA family protein [Niveibacterium sp. 24ML]MCX9156592.1 OmpA family protein [Niveibacterium sp. 24ML]